MVGSNMNQKIFSQQRPMYLKRRLLRLLKNTKIATIDVTNQRETALVWGKTIYNVIVWQDKRTVDQCEAQSQI